MKLQLTLSSLAIFVAFASRLDGANGKVARRLSEEDTQRIKKDNILKDDAKLQVDFISTENPTINVGGRTINLDSLQEYSVRAPGFQAVIDGKDVETQPRSRMYGGTVNGASVLFVKDNQNHAKFLQVQEGSRETSILPVGGEGEMVVIKSDDYDMEKMNKMFRYGGCGALDGEKERDGVDFDPNFNYDAVEPPVPTDSSRSCGSTREIDVSIMFDSTFCGAYGGGDGSGAVSRVETIVGSASQRYEVSGLCTRIRISHIEGYCNPSTDIWRNVIDNENLLPIFSNWMNDNRQSTPRDKAHFFSGTGFSSGNAIGVAYLSVVCDLGDAYGLNWITFTNNPTSQALLFAHELGHNAGAEHFGTGNTGHIMNPALNGGQNGFSSTSKNSMNRYLNQQSCLSQAGTPTPPTPTAPTPSPPGPSPGPGPSGKATSRRRLQSRASKSFNPGDETYQGYRKACGHFEYPLFLHVDKQSHLLVYGVPPDQAIAAGCPFGAAHAVFVSRHGKSVAEKEILLWGSVEDGLALFGEEESLPIGTFKLADLAQAYEATPDNNAAVGGNHDNGVYDLVTNNCATYMVKLASTLGVKIDSRITSFVARRLVEESGKDLADKIRRNSIHYFSLFGGSRRNLRSSSSSDPGSAGKQPRRTDQEVVEALVKKGAAGRGPC